MKALLRVKFSIFLIAIAVALPTAALGLALITQFVAYFQQGANPASIFRGHTVIVPEPHQAGWVSIQPLMGTTPSTGQSEEFIAAYWEAWEALSRAYETNDQSDLLTYWAGGAIQQVKTALVGSTRNKGEQVRLSHQDHHLRLVFFSEDGTVALVQDFGFSLRTVITRGRSSFQFDLKASALAVVTLDNGFWRIRMLTINYADD